jgi:predicted Zn finger-like uncharacterized protein
MASKEDEQVVVICPRCKVRLKVDETKLSPAGSRFKCPKCSTVLIVKKPAAQANKTLDNRRILVAHSNPAIRDITVSLLKDAGYDVLTAANGIDVMVKALKELPFLSVIEVALPKIYGFEICKRLKGRPETKEMKFILLPSIYDKAKYRREPVSLYGADEYIEEHDLKGHLIEKINALMAAPAKGKTEETQKAGQSVPKAPEFQQQVSPVSAAPKETFAGPAKEAPDERIERARRLARTIINDIYLYNSAKVDESIRSNNFYSVFATEVKEGRKLYDNRIPQEIRDIKDFYKEAIDNFLASREKIIA